MNCPSGKTFFFFGKTFPNFTDNFENWILPCISSFRSSMWNHLSWRAAVSSKVKPSRRPQEPWTLNTSCTTSWSDWRTTSSRPRGSGVSPDPTRLLIACQSATWIPKATSKGRGLYRKHKGTNKGNTFLLGRKKKWKAFITGINNKILWFKYFTLILF